MFLFIPCRTMKNSAPIPGQEDQLKNAMKIAATELTAQAYHRVRAMIRATELKPGQKIVQEKLAAQLGISRTPLRSALQLLEGENLVVSVPRRGMFVRKYSPEEIDHIFDCRVALEATATRLYTKIASVEMIDQLEAIFDPFSSLMKIDAKAYQKADSRFHQLLIEGCGNPFLQRLYKQGNILVCLDLIGLIRPAEETMSEHSAIINAIRSGDGELAEKEMKHHLVISQHLLNHE